MPDFSLGEAVSLNTKLPRLETTGLQSLARTLQLQEAGRQAKAAKANEEKKKDLEKYLAAIDVKGDFHPLVKDQLAMGAAQTLSNMQRNMNENPNNYYVPNSKEAANFNIQYHNPLLEISKNLDTISKDYTGEYTPEQREVQQAIRNNDAPKLHDIAAKYPNGQNPFGLFAIDSNTNNVSMQPVPKADLVAPAKSAAIEQSKLLGALAPYKNIPGTNDIEQIIYKQYPITDEDALALRKQIQQVTGHDIPVASLNTQADLHYQSPDVRARLLATNTNLLKDAEGKPLPTDQWDGILKNKLRTMNANALVPDFERKNINVPKPEKAAGYNSKDHLSVEQVPTLNKLSDAEKVAYLTKDNPLLTQQYEDYKTTMAIANKEGKITTPIKTHEEFVADMLNDPKSGLSIYMSKPDQKENNALYFQTSPEDKKGTLSIFDHFERLGNQLYIKAYKTKHNTDTGKDESTGELETYPLTTTNLGKMNTEYKDKEGKKAETYLRELGHGDIIDNIYKSTKPSTTKSAPTKQEAAPKKALQNKHGI